MTAGLRLEPWERFMLLSHEVEEVPSVEAGALLPIITSTAMVVVRQAQGRVTHAEAYAAIDRARAAITAAKERRS